MLDERWGTDEAEIAGALAALLEKECNPAVVRQAEAALDGRHRGLEGKLAEFGLSELPTEPALLAAVAWGARTCPGAGPVRRDRDGAAPFWG